MEKPKFTLYSVRQPEHVEKEKIQDSQ